MKLKAYSYKSEHFYLKTYQTLKEGNLIILTRTESLQLAKTVTIQLAEETEKDYLEILLLTTPHYIKGPLTLRDIGYLLDLSSEAIRNTQSRAFHKLKTTLLQKDITTIEDFYSEHIEQYAQEYTHED